MHKALKNAIIMMSTALALLCCQTSIADISNDTTIGRYLTVANQALPAQTDPLMQIFQVHFANSVETIGDAMCSLLQHSGYSLVDTNTLSPAAKALLVKPLPQVDRTLGPMSLQDGLLTLAGKPFGLLLDPVHRLISFRLLKAYQSLY